METERNAQASNIDELKPKTGDVYIWGILFTILVISIIESYSASSREILSTGIYAPIIKHGSMLLLGLICVYIIQRIPYQKLIFLIPIFAVFTIALTIYVMIAGDRINGAMRSMTVLGISLQPAEFAKLSIVLLIAWFMSKNQMVEGVKNRGVILCAVAVMLFGGLLFKQGLTNTILLMSVSLSMMLIGGIQIRKFIMVLIVYAIFGGMFYTITHGEDNAKNKTENVDKKGTTFTQEGIENRKGTWENRVDRFLNPVPLYTQPINSINQQEIFSYMAQANGGVLGVFPGNSRECSRLPLAFSDYIYSIIIEDLGCVGGIFMLLLYLSLLARAGMIASKCSRAFPALLVMGMAVMVVFQALFHMAINTGVFPVSGQPLPLISRGGSSIIMTSIAFGIMLSVSKFAVQSNQKTELKAEAGTLPADMRGINPTQL